MSVELEPPELGFKRPFQHEVSQILRLRNPHSDPVAFKVKTTAPKQYCVRPNSGRIEPGQDVEVKILLQAMKEDPPADAKCRDKFLVQSVLVTADKEFTNVASLWSHIEQTNKQSIQEKKIRVSFLPADASTSTPIKHNGVPHHDEPSGLESPPTYTPQPGTSAAPASRFQSVPSEEKPSRGAQDSSAGQSAAASLKSTISSAATGVANAIPTSNAELQAQLAEAKATIDRLRQQIEQSTGLRQRKTDSTEPTREAKDQLLTAERVNPPAGGVPVQLVAVLCLLSFLLAYFLF